jgi:hypothetical protein
MWPLYSNNLPCSHGLELRFSKTSQLLCLPRQRFFAPCPEPWCFASKPWIAMLCIKALNYKIRLEIFRSVYHLIKGPKSKSAKHRGNSTWLKLKTLGEHACHEVLISSDLLKWWFNVACLHFTHWLRFEDIWFQVTNSESSENRWMGFK